MEKWTARLGYFGAWSGIILALVLSVLTVFRLLPSSLRERDYQRERIRILERQVADLEHNIEIKRKFLQQLEHDPAFVERVARERLKLVRPDDEVITVIE